MYAHIRLGDILVSITPAHAEPGDTRHQIIVSDSWNAGHASNVAGVEREKIAKSVVVGSEQDALAVLRDFLENDAPSGPFLQLFPEHAP